METPVLPAASHRLVKPIHPSYIESREDRARLYELARNLVAGGLTEVLFVGAGGSLTASRPAYLHLQERATRLTVSHVQSDEFNHRPPRRLGPSSLVVVASHTGTTPETVKAIETARRAGVGRIIAFTRELDSPLGANADDVFTYGSVKTAWGPKGVLFGHLANALLVATGEDVDLEAVTDAYDALPQALPKAIEELDERCAAIAAAVHDEPITYVLGAGPLESVGYALSMCYMQEMLWMHAATFNAGEFFHGAFEIITPDVPVLLLQGEDATRPMGDRALAFLQRYTPKVHVVDSRDLTLPGVPASMRGEIAVLAMDAFITRLAQHLEAARDHDLTTRRYMFTVDY